MAIHYALFENHVTADPDDYRAAVQIIETIDLEGIADAIVAGGTTYSKEDIIGIHGQITAQVEQHLAAGWGVTLGRLVVLKPGIRGTFTGVGDAFSTARHRIVVSASAGTALNAYVQANGTVQKDPTIVAAPTLAEFHDVTTDTTNDLITGNGLARVRGSRLNFNKQAADEGIYLQSSAGGAPIKVVNILDNFPSQLSFQVPPNVIADQWTIQVRARGKDSTALRTGTLDILLTANA